MEVLSTRAIGLKIPSTLKGQQGLIRRSQIGRASEEPRNVLGKHVQHLSGRFPSRNALRVNSKDGEVPIPSGGEFAPLHLGDLNRQFGGGTSVSLEEPCPFLAGLCAPYADPRGEVVIDAVGYEELLVLGPSVTALGKTDLLVAERLAMRFGPILFIRGAIADVAIQHDERWPALRVPKDLESVFDAINVVGVAHPQHVPPIAQKPSCDVLCKGNPRAPR